MAGSHDGKWLAIASEGNAGVVDLKSFTLTRAFGLEWGSDLAFSPDDSIIAIATREKEIYIVDRASGKYLSAFRYQDTTEVCPLVFVTKDLLLCCPRGCIAALDVTSGKFTKLVRDVDVSALCLSIDRNTLYIGMLEGELRAYGLKWKE